MNPQTPPPTPTLDDAAVRAASRKRVRNTLIGAGILVLVLGQPQAGFMLYVPALPLAGWMLYSLAVMIGKPAVRMERLGRIGIWLCGVALVVGIHYVRHESTRRAANEIVAAIKDYSAAHGHCPATLQDIGISEQALHDKLGPSGYGCMDGKPYLFYAATWIIFDVYAYDFKSGEWQYQD